ncbi:MAG: hypothetical protein ACK5AZ_10610 [Bryobacteraceae bacterium]
MHLRMVLVLALACAAGGDAQQNRGKTGDTPKQSQGARPATYIGCVDQQGEEFVLLDSESMQKSAVLRARGFRTEHFANYVGEKVKVQGTKRAGETPVIAATRVEYVGPCM